MYKVVASNRFKKDLKQMKKRQLDMDELYAVINVISSAEKLPEKYRDHDLSGNYRGFRECHIQPDWLLIYRIEEAELWLFLFRTGSHSDLF